MYNKNQKLGGKHTLNPLKRTNSLQNIHDVGDSYNFYMYHVKDKEQKKGYVPGAAKPKKKLLIGPETGK